MRLFSILVLTLLFAFGSGQTAYAGDDPEPVILKDTVDASFGKVWSAIKDAMAERNCGKAQTDKIIEPEDEVGFYKGIYVSDFCMIKTGEDSTKDVMEQYGELPRIRGGIWITGRVQYKVNVREVGIRKTMIILRAELSGFEEFITNRVYFWTSNGKLEQDAMASIIAKIKAATSDE